MNIQESYRLLGADPQTPDNTITTRYKKLALHFHPDRNRENIDAANENMARLNIAYDTIMSYRFKNNLSVSQKAEASPKKKDERPADHTEKEKPKPQKKPSAVNREILIQRFIQIRENTKDSLYRYFQYNLYNIPRRENIYNRGIYNRTVFILRKSYHSILEIKKLTSEHDLIEHFDVFNKMIFDFYRASECLNLIESYTNQREVDAYRTYKKADESLHAAHRELFFDRHNRGFIKKEFVMEEIVKSEKLFINVIELYSDTSWSVESEIKLSYVKSLIRYFELFFLEEE